MQGKLADKVHKRHLELPHLYRGQLQHHEAL
jgi:hypothetical protein